MTSKQDIEQIKAFVTNAPMMDAVSRVLLTGVDHTDGFIYELDSNSMDDAEYGRTIKVWAQARLLVKARLNELVRLASSNPQPVPKNEAR